MSGEASSFPPRLLPSAPTLEHYTDLFTKLKLARSLTKARADCMPVARITSAHPLTLSGRLRSRYRMRIQGLIRRTR